MNRDGVVFCDSVVTDVFQVYSGKRFAGMSSTFCVPFELPLNLAVTHPSEHLAESTELSKSFAQQGLKLRIRKAGARYAPFTLASYDFMI